MRKSLNEYDNWMGKCDGPATVAKTKCGKKSFYLNPEAEWLQTDMESQLNNPVKIALLQNGGTVKMKTRKVKECGAVSLANTCAFDSLAQGVASSFADSKVLLNLPEENMCQMYKFAKKILKKNLSQEAYSERVNILLKCFPSKDIHGLAYINCECPIGAMIKAANLISFEENKKCTSCNAAAETHTFHTICADPCLLEAKGIECLEEAILSTFPAGCCQFCNSTCDIQRVFSPIVFVETVRLTQTHNSLVESPICVKLKSIPKIIHIDKSVSLHLRNAIEYK
ncbi:MAG: hypothetical protein NHF97_00040 [Flavobacteriia bacterium]|nr:hypothetical protein [Candidatus Bostrichicola ureolyticus]